MKGLIQLSFVLLLIMGALNLSAQIKPAPIQPFLQGQPDSILTKKQMLFQAMNMENRFTFPKRDFQINSLPHQKKFDFLNPDQYSISPTGIVDVFGTKYHIRIKEPDMSTVENMPTKIVK